jgi:hypothetical protein
MLLSVTTLSKVGLCKAGYFSKDLSVIKQNLVAFEEEGRKLFFRQILEI